MYAATRRSDHAERECCPRQLDAQKRDGMMSNDPRSCYYDHEPAWQRIAACGGTSWDAILEDDDPRSYEAIEELLGSDRCPSPGPALDLGCGAGDVAIRLARKGFDVTAIDFSETAIAIAKSNLEAARVDAILRVDDCAQPLNLPLRASFVVDNHTLHCLSAPIHRSTFLDNVTRHLAPTGLFFSETMSSEGHFDPTRFDVSDDSGINQNRTRIWVSRNRLREEMTRAGLRIIHQYLREEDSEDRSGALIVTLARRS